MFQIAYNVHEAVTESLLPLRPWLRSFAAIRPTLTCEVARYRAMQSVEEEESCELTGNLLTNPVG
jgi:hypothetical protein